MFREVVDCSVWKFYAKKLVAAMLILGIVLSDKINDSLMNSYQEYNTTLQINDDSELFEYGKHYNQGIRN